MNLTLNPIHKLMGSIPNRLALAGGWIDQPFVSRHNPKPPGSMVVVQIEPHFRPMDRSGLATGTRVVAMKLWRGRLPNRPPKQLVRELYRAENKGKSAPSGSQDMIGLVYPGINRLDYDFRVEGGIFPAHIESLRDVSTARWLESVLHVIAVAPRPLGYNPLGRKQLDPKWVCRLGQTGRDCFEAIRSQDLASLGASFNATMQCWAALLPRVIRHPLIKLDLVELLRAYQRRYAGAMYSGCGGGYLLVASAEAPPGSFKVSIRLGAEKP